MNSQFLDFFFSLGHLVPGCHPRSWQRGTGHAAPRHWWEGVSGSTLSSALHWHLLSWNLSCLVPIVMDWHLLFVSPVLPESPVSRPTYLHSLGPSLRFPGLCEPVELGCLGTLGCFLFPLMRGRGPWVTPLAPCSVIAGTMLDEGM